ncbi:HesA/MoeB/ThiF family protein [Coprobacter tertius]|uniref:HesA/MoeB/ThiF family protein n=1 Tax=Coprobacter tertius TaxID=2944915 RepID=A0ABT1MIY8_9BACT|nr:HesA/MoeB/ThiF family protein [Coprobacter tertius]MCP9612024.1 HesA/MoeB/ThiF family protein [Coprobacter tertius]
MENKRYERHLLLKEIGEEGQRKLQEASVLLVGVGGLGSPIALYLTAAGIGRIGLIDGDVVSESNLQRQVLYTEKEIGLLKVRCAKQRLQALSSGTEIEIYPDFLAPENAENIIKQYDIIVDGCDNYTTRYLINDTCIKTGKPYVYGTIGEFQGQVSVFNYQNGMTYRDLYPDEVELKSIPKATAGVLGVVPGIIGCTEAAEVIKLITGCGEVLRNRLFTIDVLSMQTQILQL